jgi:hypothetical protein
VRDVVSGGTRLRHPAIATGNGLHCCQAGEVLDGGAPTASKDVASGRKRLSASTARSTCDLARDVGTGVQARRKLHPSLNAEC